MKYPKKIKICGHVFDIKYKKGLLLNGKECWGIYDEGTNTIWLVKGMTPTRKMEILLHESIHAIESIQGLNLPESTVKQLGLGILSLIRDNNFDFSLKGK